MKLYLAGPMRSKPDLNFPAFDDAAQKLRDAGYDVCNPADHDRDFAKVHGRNPSTREAMLFDTWWICQHADGIAVLPGWAESLGAQAEVRLAMAIGVRFDWVSQWVSEAKEAA